MINEEDSAIEFAHRRLAAYGKLIWGDYLTPSHVLKLCNALEKVERGEIKRLILEMPPRCSKTIHVGDNFPAWYLGRNPTKKVIYGTYEQGQASNHGRIVRNQMLDPLFKRTFPDCHISEDSVAKHRFNTIEGGEYHAIGRGAALTGKGADILLLDDMIKDDKEAASKLVREQNKAWFRAVAYTRLQKDAAVVLCGTRWNKDDMIGFALRELADQNWVELNFPAINDQGEALWPEMFPIEVLLEIKKTIGSYFWNALYQGRPSEEEGNIFKRSDWVFWRELPRNWDRQFQSWDMNFKEGKKNSFVSGQIWGMVGADFYLIDRFKRQIGYKDTKKAFIMMAHRHPKAYKKLVEDKANGPAIIDELNGVVGGMIPINPVGSKEARAQAISAVQESGNIIIPHPDVKSWSQDYIDEHADFPNGEFRDQVDCTTQAINHFNTGMGIAALEKFLEW